MYMDTLLELVDSIKQLIPDQTYLDLMRALTEVKGTNHAKLQLARMENYIDHRETRISQYLPDEFFMLNEDEVTDEDLDNITLMLLISIDHLLCKVSQLEQSVLWSVSHAQNSRKNLSHRELQNQWMMECKVQDDL